MNNELRRKYEKLHMLTEIFPEELAMPLAAELTAEIVMKYVEDISNVTNGKHVVEVPFVLTALRIVTTELEKQMSADSTLREGLELADSTYDMIKDNISSIVVSKDPNAEYGVNTDLAERMLKRYTEERDKQ